MQILVFCLASRVGSRKIVFDLSRPTPKPKQKAQNGRRLRVEKRNNVVNEIRNTEVPVYAIPWRFEDKNVHPSYA